MKAQAHTVDQDQEAAEVLPRLVTAHKVARRLDMTTERLLRAYKGRKYRLAKRWHLVLADVLVMLAEAPGDPLQDQFRLEYRRELAIQAAGLPRPRGRGRSARGSSATSE